MSQVFEVTPEGLVVLDNDVKSLAIDDQNPILKAYLPAVVNALDLISRAEKVSVTSADQKAEMAAAREIRLALQKVRTGANKTREELKAESLKKGNAIQKVYNLLEGIVKPVEARLEEAEKFAERLEAKRKAELKEKRETEFAPFALEELHKYGDFGEMSDSAYAAILAGAKQAKAEKDRIESEARAEAERKAKEEAEERARLVAENAELAKQAEAQKLEREKAEAELRKQAEAKANEEAEAKRKAEETAKAQADTKFKDFLAAHGATKETVESGKHKVVRTENGFALYELVGSFTA